MSDTRPCHFISTSYQPQCMIVNICRSKWSPLIVNLQCSEFLVSLRRLVIFASQLTTLCAIVSGHIKQHLQCQTCVGSHVMQDTRGDRQPSFTQMDLEMTFADQDVIMQLTEALMRTVFQEVSHLRPVLLLFCPSWYVSKFTHMAMHT